MDAYFKHIRSDTYLDVKSLGDMCDAYHDPQLCEEGGTRTTFSVKGFALTDDMSNQCLELFNEKNRKNFILEEVVKLNILPHEYYCMTFSARDAESRDIHYFRGVVYCSYETEDVLLCQIKDDGGVTIPPGHDEFYDPMTAYYMAWYSTTDEEEADDLLTVGHEDEDRGFHAGIGDGSAVGSADVNFGSDVGSTVV